MSGQQAEAPLPIHIHESQAEKERIENEIMASSIKVLSAKIKELATGTDVGIPKRKRFRYSREYELDGVKYQAIYYPQIPESLTEEEKPEEFILVKRRIFDPIRTTDKKVSEHAFKYGYTLRITNNEQNQKPQNIVYVDIFPKNINDILSENEYNPRYESLGDDYVRMMSHYTKREPFRFVKSDKGGYEQSLESPRYVAKISLIHKLVGELSQIPLLA